ncbi:hypothetical protein ACIQHY_05120 [Streptomyces sp. NPDC092359]|uniref:hypothetical protein n=1 Tax=Streptomyces sp. NPDC092359 TaxID=3366014 RepID=UPI00381EB131
MRALLLSSITHVRGEKVSLDAPASATPATVRDGDSDPVRGEHVRDRTPDHR